MRRKRELANCLSFWWVKGGSSRTATSQKERRAASGGANQQNHSIWEGMNKLIVFVVAWSVGWFGLLILCGGLWAAAQPLLRTRRDKPTPNQLKVNCERNERNESKRFVEWKWIYSLEWNKRGIEWSERAPPQGAKCSAASQGKRKAIPSFLAGAGEAKEWLDLLFSCGGFVLFGWLVFFYCGLWAAASGQCSAMKETSNQINQTNYFSFLLINLFSFL